MTPHFGAGAVQAIDVRQRLRNSIACALSLNHLQDAFILGRLIAHPLTSVSRIQDALRIYEDIRFPFARTVASYSLSTGWMYTFMAPDCYDGKRGGDDLDDRGVSAYEREGMEAIKQEILRRWDFMDNSKSAPQVWEEAESKLQALLG